MLNTFKKPSLVLSLVVGFVFLIPFIVLELINVVWKFNLAFPFVLFTFMWIHQALFIFVLISMFKKQKSNATILLIKVMVLVILAYTWASTVSDQWPCFMGIPNCD